MTDSVKVLVLGAEGQLGSELRQIYATQNDGQVVVFAGRNQLDLTDTFAINEFVKTTRPAVIINCAAYTAVDRAEQEPELANQINHLAVAALARASVEIGARLIHVSTDYVFNGNHCQPYRPTDITDPQGIYGITKRDGENAFRSSGAKGVMVRTSWVYGANGNNFVKTMLRLGRERDQLNIVYDQVGAPTWARDLASALVQISMHPSLDEHFGNIYHYSNSGVCSWYDFAHRIMQLKNVTCSLTPIRSEHYPTPAKRPHYSVLDCESIKRDFGLSIAHWQDALTTALEDFH